MIEARSRDSSSLATRYKDNFGAGIWRVSAGATRGPRFYRKASVQKQPGDDLAETCAWIYPCLLAPKPALVDLEVANRGAQQRRVNSVGAGAAQHVPKNLIALGAQPGFEVALHRRAEIAAPLGQHRTALFPVLLARREAGRSRRRLAFRQQLEHQD